VVGKSNFMYIVTSAMSLPQKYFFSYSYVQSKEVNYLPGWAASISSVRGQIDHNPRTFFLVGSGAHTPMFRIFDANVHNTCSRCTLLESRL